VTRKSQAKPTLSIFSQVLQRLLDESGFYTRAEWSQFLGISEPALSQWVNDRTVPRADLLRMVIDLLRSRGGLSAGEGLMALEAVMDEPSDSISPIGSRFAPNLRSYLSVRSLAELGRSLQRMPVAEQIAFLRDGGSGAPPVGPPFKTNAGHETTNGEYERLWTRLSALERQSERDADEKRRLHGEVARLRRDVETLANAVKLIVKGTQNQQEALEGAMRSAQEVTGQSSVPLQPNRPTQPLSLIIPHQIGTGSS